MYGISADKPAAQAKWREKEGISFNLLCDPAKEVSGQATHVATVRLGQPHNIYIPPPATPAALLVTRCMSITLAFILFVILNHHVSRLTAGVTVVTCFLGVTSNS